jgi:hypothetical protein
VPVAAFARAAGHVFHHEYVIDVRPADQPDVPPTIRAVVHDPHIRTVDWNPPAPGEIVALEVDSDGVVRFDKSDPRRSRRKVSRLRKKGLA